jgi:hypothetical protein
MELYQIGRFLDLDILAQNCEDAIVQVRWRRVPIEKKSQFFLADAVGAYVLPNFYHIDTNDAKMKEKKNSDSAPI